MNTIIRAVCTECGEVELAPSDISLWVCVQPKNASHYRFRCPRCACLVSKLADDRIIGLLESGGVRSQVWSPPAEALEQHDGPPISYDDLLAFHRLLESM